MLLLLAGFSILFGAEELTPLLQPRQDASLLNILADFWGVGSQLNPVDFQGP